ncbi:MAG: PhnD/SsuA/transferrin family substrate-binding protein [Sulfurimonas sp.]|jgi:phosphonate transport system substrate-binding protein|nr:PhnD/SsuA/transferrin family substrate-binding protein [Sulfurimonas sp.]
MRFILFLLLTFFTSLLFAKEPKVLHFAPLPMYKSEIVIKQYQGMLDYLSKELDVAIKIVYHADYKDLLDAIERGDVDFAHLGPLPYASLLTRTTKPQVLVQFLNAQGESHYTCSLVTLEKNFAKCNKELFANIALTQKLSTCGYFASKEMLQKYDLDLAKLNYHYSGTHSHVILELLVGDASVGGVRTSEFLSYKHLGLKEIERSQSFPGFALIASSTLDPKIAQKISELLTSADLLMMQDWGSNVKYGAIKASSEDYLEIAKKLQNINLLELP